MRRYTILAIFSGLLSFPFLPANAALVDSTNPGFSILELVSPPTISFPGSRSDVRPPSGVTVPFIGSAFTVPFVAGLYDANDGCDAADFSGITSNYVALLARGNCSFREKALNSEGAGALGLIVFDSGINFFGGTICPFIPCATDLPSIFTTQSVGALLLAALESGEGAVRFGVVSATVPEPATLLLLALGFAGIALTRRSNVNPSPHG